MIKLSNPFGKSNPDRHILGALWCAGDGTGAQPAILAPLLAGVYIGDFGFSESQAGQLLAIEFAVLAAVNFLIAPFIGNLSRKKLALAGVGIVFSTNAVCVLLNSIDSLFLVRPLAGFGYGLSLAAANAASARADDPSRLFGHRLALLALSAFLLFLIIPPLIEKQGSEYIFVAMAALNAAVLRPIMKFPDNESVTAATNKRTSTAAQAKTPTSFRLIALMMIIALSAFFLRDTMAYVYLERLGVHIGMTREAIGQIIGVGAIVGIFGPLIAVWLAKRFGLVQTTLAFCVGAALLSHNIVLASTTILYSMLVLIQGLENLGGYTLHMALASKLDAQGRVATACGGAALASYAVSSLLLGYATELGGTRAMISIMLVFSTVSISMIIAILCLRKRWDKSEHSIRSIPQE